MKIIIAGGTGLVGKVLSKELKSLGHDVCLLSRSPQPEKNIYYWNPQKMEIDETILPNTDVLINLAGAGIADSRWTRAYKKTILDSRVKANELFASKIKTGFSPKQYISASAIGIYGDREDELLTEESVLIKDNFLTEVCIDWENAIQEVENLGIPTTSLRIGIVLTKEGGALAKMLPSYQFGLGTYFGNGGQWYSWIHIDDLVKMIIYSIDHKLIGCFNAVSPDPQTNKNFAETISNAYGKSHLVMPVPKLWLKLGMGEMSAIVLYSSKVSSKKIEDNGFEFQYPLLIDALKEIVEK